MYVSSLELADYRNIGRLNVSFSEGTNIFFGDNAQGKTNILEALFLLSTTKSHRGTADRDLIRFGCEEAHIRSVIMKKEIDYKIDMHLRKGRSKGIAVNGQRIRKASQLIGLLHIIFFSRKISESSRTDLPSGADSWIWSCASWRRRIFTT